MTTFTGQGLKVASIAKRYGATIALDGVDFAVRPGEIHALVGENGAGKSTLMGVLAGGIESDRGTMTLDDATYAPTSPHDARKKGVALIHQELSLCPHLTVQENILLGGEIARGGWIDRRKSRERALELLRELPHPEIAPERRVRDLSLPAQQIVEICRTVAADTRVLLMDEPTSSLQGADVDRLFALIRRLAARGVAIVYISHFLEEVRKIANTFTVLRDGRVAGNGEIQNTTNNRLISLMVGREASGLFPTRTVNSNIGVAMSVRDLSAPPRLKRASFELRRGEILGIAGLLGSGRTELVRALFGLDKITSGTIELRTSTSEAQFRPTNAKGTGAATTAMVSPASPSFASSFITPSEFTPAFSSRRSRSTRATSSDRVQSGVGYVSEDRKGEGLALPMSVADNLCATKPELSVPQLGLIDTWRQSRATKHWIDELRIRARSPLQSVRSLSGGNQQKVAIGRLLHQEAQILLLDEPTRGIDIGSKADVYETVAQQAASGCAVLLVSSYLPELFGMCDRIAVMCRGELSEARPVSEWTPEQVMAVAIGTTT